MAASRTVTLNVIGNSSGAQQALKAVGDHSEAQSKRMGKAFEGVLGTLNSTGVLGPFGEAIEKVSGAFDKMGEHGKAAGAKLMGLGAAGVGIGGLFTAIGDKDKAASQQLKASVEAIGGSYDDAKEKFEAVIKSNEKFGDSAKATQDALSILTTGLGSADRATADMGTVLDIAAKRHEDLTAAATDWIKINEGKGTKILATLGLAHTNNAAGVKDVAKATKEMTAADDASAAAKQKLTDLLDIQHGKATLTEADHIALRNAQEKVAETTKKVADAHDNLARAQSMSANAAGQESDAAAVQRVVHGQASAAADTFTGHLKAMTTTVEDQAAKIGQKYGPALMGISSGMTVLGAGVEGVSAILGKFKGAQEAATVATEGLTTATEAQDVAEGIALGPILLIVGAVAAVGAALYELWQHWSTIWGWIKDAASAAWQWIQKHTVLIGALFGPLGIIIAELGEHWKGIWDGIQTAVSTVWGVIKPIIDQMTRAIKDVAGPVGKLAGAVGGAAGKVGGFFGGLLADGGTAYGNTPYLVGEEGPELFVPGATGAVIPNGAMGGVNISGGIHVYPSPGMDEDALAEKVRRKLLQSVRGNVNLGMS